MFRKRIHQRHRTGSEDASRYFSQMCSTGRMSHGGQVPSDWLNSEFDAKNAYFELKMRPR